MSDPGNSETVDVVAASKLPRHWNRLFWLAMSSLGFAYLVLIIAMLVADLRFADWEDFQELLSDPRVRYSIWLSLISCTVSAILATWVAVPTGYVLARLGRESIIRRFGHGTFCARLAIGVRYIIDTILDIPIVLPPLVVGISLLVLMQTPLGRWADGITGDFFSSIGYPGVRGITYEIPAVILAQFSVAAAFAIRTMRDTFEQISERPERVACTLGASRFRAFADVGLPQAWRGIVAAFTLAWARSLGEFGPILIFAGTARMKTEVLSTTVYLNFQFGNLRGAVVASLILVTLAVGVLVLTRMLMLGGGAKRGLIA